MQGFLPLTQVSLAARACGAVFRFAVSCLRHICKDGVSACTELASAFGQVVWVESGCEGGVRLCGRSQVVWEELTWGNKKRMLFTENEQQFTFQFSGRYLASQYNPSFFWVNDSNQIVRQKPQLN